MNLRIYTFALIWIVMNGLVATAQLPSYLPTNGLVAWYPFNGNANDESGNGNDGVVSGATLTTDRNGIANKAYYFDGQTSRIDINNSFYPVGSNHSINMWFLLADSTNNTNTFYNTSPHRFESMGYNTYFLNQPYGFSYCIGDGTNWNPCGANASFFPTFSKANWNLISFVKQGNSWLFYINGALVHTYSDNNNVNQLLPISIGAITCCSGEFFNGKLDDVAIYNRALTQTELTALYTATATNTGGGPISTTTAPPGIPYQAEVRNESGEVLANTNVNIRFTLHELTANGTASYQETHALATNELGLFAATIGAGTIGAGTAVQGTFASINWAQTTKFLQVEVDTGSGWITMGNQQLMSVPYALYAANGPVGPAGPQGLRGETGPAGPQGPQGASAPASNGSFNHYIGERFGGGIVFHVYRDTLGEEHGLIIAEKIFPGPFCDCPLADNQYWSNRIIALNATNTYNGEINTSRLMLDPAIATGIIGTVSNLSLNGFPDWYLPSIGELKLIMRDTWTLMQGGNWEDETGITQSVGIEQHWIASSSFDPFSGNMRLWGPSSYDSSFGIITLDVEQVNTNTVGLAVRKF